MTERSLWVAAIILISTWTGWVPPTRSISFSCNTLKSLTCAAGGSSPISSRKIVPLCARSNRPRFFESAPVKAPFSWPNSSLSISVSGIAPQLTLIKGPSLRWEDLWMALAITSLPAPVSPIKRTGLESGATWRTKSITPFRPKSAPMISSPKRLLISSWRYSLWSASISLFSHSSRCFK